MKRFEYYNLATSLGKGILKIVSIDDPEAREILKMIKDVRSLYVLSYEDCSKSVQAKVSSRLEKMLEGNMARSDLEKLLAEQTK